MIQRWPTSLRNPVPEGIQDPAVSQPLPNCLWSNPHPHICVGRQNWGNALKIIIFKTSSTPSGIQKSVILASFCMQLLVVCRYPHECLFLLLNFHTWPWLNTPHATNAPPRRLSMGDISNPQAFKRKESIQELKTRMSEIFVASRKRFEHLTSQIEFHEWKLEENKKKQDASQDQAQW